MSPIWTLLFAVCFASLVVLGTALGSTFFYWLWVRQTRLSARRRPVGAPVGRVLAVVVTLFGFGTATAWAAGASPVFGLAGVLFVPLVVRQLEKSAEACRTRAMEASALAFFQSLRGLVQVGISLPSALFQLAQEESTLFSRELHRHLHRFAEGKSLARCLARFRRASGRSRAGALLSLVELAYANGLPVSSLLARLIPIAETEFNAEARIRSLRMGALLQAGVALVIPWVLFGVILYFQPELAETLSAAGYLKAIVLGALVCEGIGVWSIGRCARFY